MTNWSLTLVKADSLGKGACGICRTFLGDFPGFPMLQTVAFGPRMCHRNERVGPVGGRPVVPRETGNRRPPPPGRRAGTEQTVNGEVRYKLPGAGFE